MANPARTPQEPLHHIKSAARKLPIKRKPNPNEPPFSIIVDDGEGRGGSVYPAPDPDDDPPSDPSSDAVPFKFQRIWSEADEVRFLRGLLSCHGQGLVFPRDLNVFFDRFSDNMTQPYTRSQLSEKLRRLRKKFRIASSRVARGLDISAMSGHDRELFELSTKLWDPEFADSSPFVASGPDASKRRRRFPPPPDYTKHANILPAVLPKPAGSLLLPAAGVGYSERKDCRGEEKIGSVKHMIMKAVLDVFDSSLKEVKISSAQGGELAKKWEEQRALELNVLASRLRLVVEDALQG